MSAESDRRYAKLLERILRDAKRLQKLGRLRDPMSQREIAFLEHEVMVLRSARMR